MTDNFALIESLVELIDATDKLPIRSNAPRAVIFPYQRAREHAIASLREVVGGTNGYATIVNARNYIYARRAHLKAPEDGNAPA